MSDPLAPCGHHLTWFVHQGDFMAPIVVDTHLERLSHHGAGTDLPEGLYWCRTCGWVNLDAHQYGSLVFLRRNLEPGKSEVAP